MQHRVSREGDIALRHLDKRKCERLYKHIVDRQLHSAAFKAGVELTAQLQERVEADIDRQVDMGRLLHRLGQAARNCFAHIAELDHLVRDAEIGDCSRCSRHSWRDWCGSRDWRLRCRCLNCRCSSRTGCIDIFLHDTAAGTGSSQRREIDTAFRRKTLRQGAGFDTFIRRGCGNRCTDWSGRRRRGCHFNLGRWRCCLCNRSRCRLYGRGIFIFACNQRDNGADLHAIGTFSNHDLRNHTFIDRFKLHRGFVSLNLGDQIARRNAVSFFNEPAGKRALFHRRGQSGHFELDWHAGILSIWSRISGRHKGLLSPASSGLCLHSQPFSRRLYEFTSYDIGRGFGETTMRTYLVVIDESEEARLALRFASRRAAKTGGAVHILALIEKADFVAWGGVQATMEAENREKAEELVSTAAGTIFDELGLQPQITIRDGEGVEVVKDMLDAHPEIAALVLGAAAQGNPGPMVAHFTGNNAGTMRCPVMVIPGSLNDEQIDELS